MSAPLRRCPALVRVRLVALMAVREALHLRLVPLFAALALAPVAAVFWLRGFNFGTAEWKFIVDFGHGALGAGGLLLAVLATVQTVSGDGEHRTAQMLLSRALTPAEFLAGKLTGLLALLTWFAAAVALVLVALLRWRAGDASDALAVALAGIGLIWLKLTVTVALTLLIASYARSALFAAGAALLLVMLAHLRHLVGPGADWTRAWLLVLPDFQLFDPERLVGLAGRARALLLLGSAAYAAAYVTLYTALAAWLFKRREH
ncbi:MAG: hypothetical protein HY302_01720 [Opitutae bacterium]|nr:hypothetical protein [Opitutae bacterium]